MFGWWRRRKEMQARVDAERTPEHWDRVRFEIRKRTGNHGTDTATKLLEDR